MALPDYSMRQLLEAGVHFGHQTHRWNPRMQQYLYGSRNKIHIIDLTQTVPLLHQALKTVRDVVAQGGRVLFVGTKRQAQDAIDKGQTGFEVATTRRLLRASKGPFAAGDSRLPPVHRTPRFRSSSPLSARLDAQGALH